MNTIKSLTLFCFLLWLTNSFSQEHSGYMLWSSTRKLKTDDFAIKTKQLETTSSFAQFSVDYQVSGFDFLTKNFNKKVRNQFLPTASWIDTTSNVNQSLIYQQTLFDICEIYARQFRKALKENRKQLAKGNKIAEDLNNRYMSEFSKRRVEYDIATNFAMNNENQKEWELQIQRELIALEDYSYDK